VNEITLHTVSKGTPSRREVETFIHTVFKASYGANVTEFMPTLVALRDENGELIAAFGMRSADKEKLFLEQYLDMPIEQLLTEKLGKPITRNKITCIGNLAVSNPRNAGVLITHIIQHNLEIGVEWCVATVHSRLKNSLIKGGRDVYPLCLADKASLSPEEQLVWGSYYDDMPQVIAIKGVADD
jgi:hypothetical protein